jgi:DUF4097 and DUF4098 domain-containing protein YvlB
MNGIFTAALAMLALTTSALARGADFERTVPAAEKGAVDISSVSGRVEVTGWDRAEVAVHAELGEGERVDVSTDHDRTGVKVVFPHISSHGDVMLRVQVPKGSELTISGTSADVETRGVSGAQRLNTVSGDITAELAGSDLELKTISGSVHLKGHGQPAHLRISTVSGDVSLEHGAGDLEAGTTSGQLVISLDSARSVRVRSTSGDLRFNGALARDVNFEASSVSGSLHVHASAEGGYAYELSSFSGDLSTCTKTREKDEDAMPGHRMEGTLGAGAGHVRLKSMSGDIELCERK